MGDGASEASANCKLTISQEQGERGLKLQHVIDSLCEAVRPVEGGELLTQISLEIIDRPVLVITLGGRWFSIAGRSTSSPAQPRVGSLPFPICLNGKSGFPAQGIFLNGRALYAMPPH